MTAGATLLTSGARRGVCGWKRNPRCFCVFPHYIIISQDITAAGNCRPFSADIRAITWMLTQPDDGGSAVSPKARNRNSPRSWEKKKKEDDESHYCLPGRLRGNVAVMFPRAPNGARCYAAQLRDGADAICNGSPKQRLNSRSTLMQPAANRCFHLALQQGEL